MHFTWDYTYKQAVPMKSYYCYVLFTSNFGLVKNYAYFVVTSEGHKEVTVQHCE